MNVIRVLYFDLRQPLDSCIIAPHNSGFADSNFALGIDVIYVSVSATVLCRQEPLGGLIPFQRCPSMYQLHD